VINGGIKKSRQEVKEILDNMDYANNKQINYSEFLSATIHLNNHTLSKNRKIALFKLFDVDDSDLITTDNIHKAFNKLGVDL